MIMRHHPWRLIAAVLIACAATAAAAWAHRDGRPGGQTRVVDHRGWPAAAAPAMAPAAPPPAQEHPSVLATLDHVAFDAHRLEDGTVAVTGQALLLDRTPGHVYVWLLRVYDAGKGKGAAPLREHHYLKAAISPPVGERVDPAFAEVLALPAGSYRVELTLYGVPAGFPFRRLKFGEDMGPKAFIKLTRSARVVLD